MALCVSKKKGTAKIPVDQVRFIENYGLDGDAHAGNWHRQVSLLSYQTREEFKQEGALVEDGAFGENMLVSGIDFTKLTVGTRIQIGEVLLELTQIGKSCHHHCAIYHQVGHCIMPTHGVFARVLLGGMVHVHDKIKVIENHDERFRVAVVTLSDKASQGLREDLSGPYIQDYLTKHGYLVTSLQGLHNKKKIIEKELINLSDRCQNDLIITTGGTGLSVRDVTPEATRAIATKNVPGISEALRYESMKYTPRAMLSRGVSVIRNQTLIVNLPGSLKAVKESLDIIESSLKHGLNILKDREHECGRHD